jgi:hypothetical protein
METIDENIHTPANASIPWCSLSEFMENSVFYNVVMSGDYWFIQFKK